MLDNVNRVAVAMSGGVDSSAVALILRESGWEVVGVAMQVWDYRKSGNCQASCCSPDDFQDARMVASHGGFPFYVLDFEDVFEKQVIEPFVASYMRGLTPNPCLDCNKHIKFKELHRRAASFGCHKVATGHYATIRNDSNNNWALFTAADKNKDQSYFLYAMTQAELSSTLFPLGAMQKAEVRDYLARRGLSMAEKPESQDICFVSNSVPYFLEARFPNKIVGGKIVRSDGMVLGKHSGIHRYTVGQRKGLGVSATSPLYVIGLDAANNEVIVGEKAELEREGFLVRDVNWICGSPPQGDIDALVKMRYRHEGVRCRVRPVKDCGDNVFKAEVNFLNQWATVTPGQAAVFYSLESSYGDLVQVLGGGIIDR
ncbi:MAG: tRNA 2-thiouridine(34) synthase MnmA [Deltaproteobacteria bacterium]|nr:tRNA 2-thiouridine(34) synthase MnmA [Deltaproteobacteria bacterium]